MQKLCFHQKVNLAALLSVVVFCGVEAKAQAASAADAGEPAANGALKVVGNISSETMAPKIAEDWSTPSLEGSDLRLGYALVGEVDKSASGYTREFARVQWRSGDPVDLYIVKPDGVEKPPVILYLYSYPFELDRFRDDGFCRFLTTNGFAAVGFASALTAGRYHAPRPMKEWFVSELRESLATSAHDVQMILNYLAMRGDLDVDRVGMFGDGSGASIAILAAAVDPRIKTLDLLDPWGDWPDWVAKSTLIPENERPGLMKPEWLAGVAPLDPLEWLPKLKRQKLRIQLVSTVTVTPEEAKRKVEAAAPSNAEIVHYADAQAFKNTVASGIGFDWIKEHVEPGAIKQPQANGDLESPNPTAKPKDSQQ